MSGPKNVVVSAGLGEFFREEVSEARGKLHLDLSDLIEFYLVNLLCDFARKDRGPVVGGEPLALIYHRALGADQAQRMKLFKDLGDVSLFVAGFFVQFIERSLVSLDYYISMGGNAYHSLAELVGGQGRGEPFSELYAELGAKFTELVDLLNEVAERAREKGSSDRDLLRLYDRWLQTRSDRIRRMLIEEGVIPQDGLLTDYVQ